MQGKLISYKDGTLAPEFSKFTFTRGTMDYILISLSKTQNQDNSYLFCFYDVSSSDSCDINNLKVLQAVTEEGRTGFVQKEVSKEEMIEIVNTSFLAEYTSSDMGMTQNFRYTEYLAFVHDSR